MSEAKMTVDACPRHNPRLAQQELGEKAVLLHYEGRRILGLNETGSKIWAMLDGERSLGEIIDTLMPGIDAPREQVEAEVLEFATSLLHRDLLSLD